jgi:hypothetical protein
VSPVYQIFNIITAKEDTAMPFPYPKRAIGRLAKSARDRSYPVGNRPFSIFSQFGKFDKIGYFCYNYMKKIAIKAQI